MLKDNIEVLKENMQIPLYSEYKEHLCIIQTQEQRKRTQVSSTTLKKILYAPPTPYNNKQIQKTNDKLGKNTCNINFRKLMLKSLNAITRKRDKILKQTIIEIQKPRICVIEFPEVKGRPKIYLREKCPKIL